MRVLLTIFLIVVICALAFVLLAMFGVVGSSLLESVFATALHGGFWYKFLYAAICVVMIVVAFVIMFFGSHKRPPAVARVAELNGGTIVITTRAIEELVQREINNTPSIKAAHTHVVSYGDYIDITANLSLLPGESIPEVTKELQNKLQEDIQRQTGIQIRELKITVTDVADSMSNQKTSRVV